MSSKFTSRPMLGDNGLSAEALLSGYSRVLLQRLNSRSSKGVSSTYVWCSLSSSATHLRLVSPEETDVVQEIYERVESRKKPIVILSMAESFPSPAYGRLRVLNKWRRCSGYICSSFSIAYKDHGKSPANIVAK